MRLIKEFIFIMGMAFLFHSCSSKSNAAPQEIDPDIQPTMMTDGPLLAEKAVDFRVEMRKLWEDQVTWTRTEIFCLVDDLPGGSHALQRLLDNQDHIGHALRAYYGVEPAERITNLLKDNVNLTADAIKAIETKNTKMLNGANRKWFANADSVAVILSQENPNYGMGELKLLLHEHQRLLTEIAAARVKKDYGADIDAYDEAHHQVLKMADVLSEGIIHRFPDKFR